MTISENQVLLRDFYRARAVRDARYMDRCVTDDVRWTIAGKCTIQGKREFSKAIREMSSGDPRHVRVTHIITDNSEGAVQGTMTGTSRTGEKQTLSFCDIYKLSGSRDPKIREIISYTIAIEPAVPPAQQ